MVASLGRIVFLVFMLSACGQKGALYLPDEASEQKEQEESALQD